MRTGAYRIFEIVAWVGLGWYAFEAAATALIGDASGAAISAGMALLAGCMVIASRWRRATLAAPATMVVTQAPQDSRP